MPTDSRASTSQDGVFKRPGYCINGKPISLSHLEQHDVKVEVPAGMIDQLFLWAAVTTINIRKCYRQMSNVLTKTPTVWQDTKSISFAMLDGSLQI